MPSITLNDRTIHYLDEGAGDTPVVLVHTFPLDAEMWEPQIRHLNADYRVIAPDLAGFGESESPADPAGCSVESWADDVIGLCGGLGLDHVTLVGASLGADVALAVARRARDLPGALALAGLRPAPASSEEQRHCAEQQAWVTGGGDLGAIVDRFAEILVGTDSSRRDEVVQACRFMMRRTSTGGWASGFAALGSRPDPIGDADKLDLPVVLFTGEQDQITSAHDVRNMASVIPGAGFIEVPDAGHLPNLENPAVFNEALGDLLEGRMSRRPHGKHPWPAAPATTR